MSNKIQKIKDIVSIIDIANRYGANSNSKGKCKHNPLRTEATCSLVLYPETNTYYDFGNKDGGDVIDFVCAADGFDIPDSIENICRMYNIDTNDNYIPTPKTITVPEKDYIKPEKLLTAFNAITKRFNENTRESLFTIAPEYVFKEAKSEDKIEFFNLVRYYEPERSPVVLLPDSKGTSYTFRYRYKTIDDEQKKWVAHYNTKSNYPYCRLNENRLTLIVEGSRDFLTALLCGYSVIALPSAGFQLDNELLKDRLCVFIDDDDDKEFMKPLFENAICEKIWFEHKKFKEITKCNSKDFSDYLYQFDNLEKFKHSFEKFIYTLQEDEVGDWKSQLHKISTPVTIEDIKKVEDQKFLYPELIINNNITFLIAQANTGKSALTFAIIKELLDNNDVEDIFFFDPDSNIGYVKPIILSLSEKYGDRFNYYNGVKTSTKEMKDIMKSMSVLPNGTGKKSLVICDGYQFFLDGSISEEKNHKAFIEISKGVRDRFGATMIVLHHTKRGKDEDGNSEYLGSQIVEAFTDNMLLMQEKNGLELFVKKSRADKKNNVYKIEIDFKNREIKNINLKGKRSEIIEDNSDEVEIDITLEIIEDFMKGKEDVSMTQLKTHFKATRRDRPTEKKRADAIFNFIQESNKIKWNGEKGNKAKYNYLSNDPVVTVYSDDDIDNIFGGME